ncbi:MULTISPECIES: hypothetical protein [Paenibacillus]|uniref:hypothetical protein n=1 Tax=Paenibacillus TaxID=44249 RepID=UPI000BBD8888|nr:hypothetical protein [Paenibacillus lautus]PCL91938.1 hypothetical protein CPZ30_14475 [Paenibacillus lautus]
MKLVGTIEKIIVDGYERLIYISFTAIEKKLWCHFIQHEEYLEEGKTSEILRVGQNLTFIVGIDLVNDYSVITKESEFIEDVLQPKSESPHSIVSATVIEKEDDYTLLCDVEGFGRNIVVEFEEKVNVETGTSLRLKGNLKVELK